MNKRYLGISLSALLAVTTVAAVAGTPVLANLSQVGESLTQLLHRPKVSLALKAEQQVTQVDVAGTPKVSWQDLQSGAVIAPGNLLRYTVTGKNLGDDSARKLTVIQPIPKQMVYVLGSATASQNAALTFSIDQGKTFVENPIIQVTLPDGTVQERSAPAEAYTHVRWAFGTNLDPRAGLSASYEVRVR